MTGAAQSALVGAASAASAAPSPPDATSPLEIETDEGRAMRASAGDGAVKQPTADIDCRCRRHCGTLSVTPRASGNAAPDRFVLDCGTAGTRAVEVNVVDNALPLRSSRHHHSVVGTLPALTGDPTSYSDDDLRSRGYPARPNAELNPRGYAAWLDAVSRPFDVIDSTGVSGPARNVNRTTAAVWSGYALDCTVNDSGKPFCDGSPFYEMYGCWYVPTVTSTGYRGPRHLNPSQWTIASSWVGIDGHGYAGALAQLGTNSGAIDYGGTLYTGYQAWTEVIPAGSILIPNFAVDAGNLVCAQVSMNFTNKTATFTMWDWTQLTTTSNIVAAAPSTTGFSAESIMERPTYAEFVHHLRLGRLRNGHFGRLGVQWIQQGNHVQSRRHICRASQQGSPRIQGRDGHKLHDDRHGWKRSGVRDLSNERWDHVHLEGLPLTIFEE